MAKYQFFCLPETERRDFTFLDMASSTFQEEKAQLLKAGFIVDDDVIYADSPEEATDKFRSHFTHAVGDYAHAHVAGGMAAGLMNLLRWFK